MAESDTTVQRFTKKMLWTRKYTVLSRVGSKIFSESLISAVLQGVGVGVSGRSVAIRHVVSIQLAAFRILIPRFRL